LGFEETLQGQNVRVTNTAGVVKVNDLATVSAVAGEFDVLASNANTDDAVIHVIDQVLMIPVTVSELAFVTESLSTLSSVLENSVYVDIKNAVNAGARTVFAPSNAAFTAINFALPVSTDAAGVAATKALLQYHVLGSKVVAANVPALGFEETLQGQNVRVTNTAGVVKVNDLATVSAVAGEFDVLASNANTDDAVIHVIDQVLMIPVTVSELAFVTESLSTLSSVLENSVYVDIKNAVNAGARTVFAPSNAAFSTANFALPVSTDAVAVDALKAMLQYHVLGSKVVAAGVPTLDFVATLQGGKVRVTNTAGTVRVNLATVSAVAGEFDVLANENQTAVIHVIDKVLMIPVTVSELAAVLQHGRQGLQC